ncbi:MAG TPA: sugar transferase, partial [Gemmatimonadaceae bacterium]
MLVIAALVKATSRGPVFYSQMRVGIDRRARRWRRDDSSTRDRNLGGAPFRIYKFRTMRVEQSSAQVWARRGDSRITPIGAVLRKYRLDELPQLFNVLRGDMNVVGPRPEQPEIFGRLRDQIASYPWRQRVLPGITGWAQVNLRYDETIDDVRRKVAYDLAYIRRASALQDLRIMLRTLPVMLGSRLGW